jgi:hypothetical protein
VRATASRRSTDNESDQLTEEEWEMVHYLRRMKIDIVEKLELLTDPDIVRARVAGVIDLKLREQSRKRQQRRR